MQEHILEFLKNRTPKLCVISTIDSDKPESAVVGYAIKDDLTLVISTKNDTRKYKNLQNNNHVAVVIGWSFSEDNVQYEGTATLIESGEEYQETEQFFFSQNPDAAKFKDPKTIFVEIKPTWIRFLDLKVTPPHPEEITF